MKIRQELPAGRSLIDHPLYRMEFAAPPIGSPLELPLVQTLPTWSSQSSENDALDLHIVAVSRHASADSLTGTAFRLMPALMKPRSSGRLRLQSADPAVAPSIDLGYFTDVADMPRMIEAMRRARELARTPPLADLVIDEIAPGTRVGDDPHALEDAIHDGILTYHHPVATCRMGPSDDPGSVVDPRGRVHGLEHLWVIDASIMPTLPAANTNIPTIMVAERCAAWLQ